MKVYLTDQKNNFERHLKDLKKRSVMEYDKSRLTKKISTVVIQTDKIDFQTIFDYRIFPDNIMTYLTEWKLNNREMKVGDTIVQQVYIPPTKIYSQKIIFGVRISEIISEPDKKGFSYETLEGHVEKGISTFTIEQTDEKILFKILTYSTPGSFLSRALGPVFSKPYQKYSTRKALGNVKRQLEKARKPNKSSK